MKQYTFETKQDYETHQIQTTTRKTKRGKANLSTTQGTIQAICGRLRSEIAIGFGLCHGVRSGEELELFQRFAGGLWLGTELHPDYCDGLSIIQHNFSDSKPEWMKKFDCVYSNSLDHAQNPKQTLRVWLSQLSENGVLVLEWHKYQGRLSVKGKADCFAASLQEYRGLISGVGGLLIDELTIIDPPIRKPRPLKRTLLFVQL